LDLRALRAFIFDLDGCVYVGETLVPGVLAVLERLRRDGRRILFLTNNSREDGAALQVKLTRLGVQAEREEVLSAAEATGPYIRERFGPTRLLAIGSDTFRRLLAEAGHELVALEDPRGAPVVVIGHDFEFDYRKLTALARAVKGGAAFVAVNVDPHLPVEHGQFFPGCGVLVAAVSLAGGVRPEVVGKPNPTLFRAALARLQVSPREAAMVGDSLNSDVRGARAVGLHSIWLAPPGVDPGEMQPDLTIRAFAELEEML
jgi:4-nitrophenyl phosphatase